MKLLDVMRIRFYCCTVPSYFCIFSPVRNRRGVVVIVWGLEKGLELNNWGVTINGWLLKCPGSTATYMLAVASAFGNSKPDLDDAILDQS